MSNGGDAIRKLMESLSVVEQGDNPSLLDAVQKAVRSAEVDADFHGLYIDLKKILRTYTSEAVEEGVTEGGFELEVESTADGETYISIIQSGHPIAAMEQEDFEDLIKQYRKINRGRQGPTESVSEAKTFKSAGDMVKALMHDVIDVHVECEFEHGPEDEITLQLEELVRKYSHAQVRSR